MRLLAPLRRAGTRLRRAAPAYLRRMEGNVALEFALIAPVLLLLLLGLVDFGRAVAASRELSAGAAAAALFAVHNGDPQTNRSEIEELARGAAGRAGAAATVDVAETYLCGLAAADRDTICADGRLPALYVEVVLSGAHPLLFALPGLGESIPLAGRAVMRAR
jgi:Flp pilus assembly protein TadG